MTITNTILVVDDDEGARVGLLQVLEIAGYVPVGAGSGREALEIAENAPPDIAILDLKLGDMSGLEVMERIAAFSAGIECIVVTGHSSQQAAIEAVNLGAYGFLQKPYDVEQLLLMIRRGIEKQSRIRMLKESELRFRAVVETATDAIVTIDDAGNVVFWNRAARDLFGYEADEIMGKPFVKLVPERFRDRQAWIWARETVYNGGKVLGRVTEALGLRRDCGEFSLEISVARWSVAGGTHYTAIVRDISQRKEMEKAARLSKKALLRAQRIARLGNWTWHRDTDLMEWSPEMFVLLGADIGTFRPTGRGFLDAMHPEDRRTFEAAIEGMPASAPSVTVGVRMETYDDRQLTVQIQAEWPRSAIKTPMLVGTLQDITELAAYREKLDKLVAARTQKLSAALQETTKAYDRIGGILKSVGDGLIVLDHRKRIMLMNEGAENLLDMAGGAAQGRPIDAVITDEGLRRAIAQTVERRTVHECDLNLPCPEPGSCKVLRASISEIADARGKHSGVVVLIRDVTREREVDRMKTEFVTIAAHELRTPLTSIQGFSELLLTRESLSPSQKTRFLEYINEQSARLGHIVTDFLDVSRIESGAGPTFVGSRYRPFDVVSELVACFTTDPPQSRFRLEVSDPEIMVCGDPDKTRQAVENVLSNAMKYSPSHVPITIRMGTDKGKYRIVVADRGIGMTRGQVDNIFTKFYRTAAASATTPGAGLGMTIVKYMMEVQGGGVSVESRMDSGTTVTLTLPLNGPGVDSA